MPTEPTPRNDAEITSRTTPSEASVSSSSEVAISQGPISKLKRTQVALVGAGPGDPGLVTLRGAQWLRRADVVLYDGLSNPAILLLAPQAEHICVGKHGRSRIWSQEEINTELVTQATKGRCVVRLKGGDPAVFARTAEEVNTLIEAGIAYEIVPGITAALAAGSYAGIPITHRGLASAVALVTGHEEPHKSESALDWQALAAFPGTLVIYMGVTTVETWTQALINAGKSPETRAAIVRRCSLSDQQVIVCNLSEVAGNLTPSTKIRPPVIVIIGPVANLAQSQSWFDHRPLFSQRVLVTRAEEQSQELTELLQDQGAEVVCQPAIQISPIEDAREIDLALSKIAHYDSVVFTSRNAVKFFFERVEALGMDARSFAGLTVAAVGRRTAEALKPHGLRADIVPENFNAESLAHSLIEHLGASDPASSAGKASRPPRILYPQASRAKSTLADTLRNAGFEVDPLIVYRHEDVVTANPEITYLIESGQIQWTIVTSSAIGQSLHNLFGDHLHRTKLLSLSPKTTATLRELGIVPAAEAAHATIDGAVETLVETVTNELHTE